MIITYILIYLFIGYLNVCFWAWVNDYFNVDIVEWLWGVFLWPISFFVMSILYFDVDTFNKIMFYPLRKILKK